RTLQPEDDTCAEKDVENGPPMPQFPPPAPASSPTRTSRGPLGLLTGRGSKRGGLSFKGSKDV
ncbi:hypothetical protein AAVH_29093, partial [Aphelenchoides avenae]